LHEFESCAILVNISSILYLSNWRSDR